MLSNKEKVAIMEQLDAAQRQLAQARADAAAAQQELQQIRGTTRVAALEDELENTRYPLFL